MTRQIAGLCTALLVLLPVATVGQVLTGRVVEAPSGQPISAALVELLSPDSAQLGAALTGDDGRFRVQAPRIGVYGVQVRRLGYAPVRFGSVRVGGTQNLDVEMRAAPIALEGISGSATRRCENGPGVGPQTQVLWDLVSGALDAASVAEEAELLRYQGHEFVRDLDVERTRILIEGVGRSAGSIAFQSADPDDLHDKGYVEMLPGNVLSYYMPDTRMLGSEEFLETHCFHVVASGDPGVVGLGFGATPSRLENRPRRPNRTYRDLFGREVVEVRGTLWVDRSTGALQELEYSYEGFEEPSFAEHAGGYARFEQLGGGIWVVRQWWLRMPNLGLDGDDDLEVQSVREAGGYLVAATDSLGRSVLPEQDGGSVRGQLVASDLRIPVSNVVVRLSGSPWITRTDAEGNFLFRDMPPGPYLVTWWAPRLDSIGVQPDFVPVEVTGGEQILVTLKGPGAQETLDRLCLGMQAGPELGVVRVRVESPSGGIPGNQPVQLRAADPAVDLDRMNGVRDATATFCSVPTGVPLVVTAPPFEGAVATLTLEPGGIQLVELELGPPGG